MIVGILSLDTLRNPCCEAGEICTYVILVLKLVFARSFVVIMGADTSVDTLVPLARESGS